MRIQTNVESLNAYRNLSGTNRQQSTHMERLSSGFRINRAADDAAGLAISEKMRGQISGLDQATANAQDATSLIQTAEGALNESHEILQRMRELANQAANDTNTADDRAEIQEEINELTSELNRIGNTTEFNTQNLLDGGEVITEAEVEATGLIDEAMSPDGGETDHTAAEVTIDMDDEVDASDFGGESFSLVIQGEEITINFIEDGDITENEAEFVEADSHEATIAAAGDGVTEEELAGAVEEALNETCSSISSNNSGIVKMYTMRMKSYL